MSGHVCATAGKACNSFFVSVHGGPIALRLNGTHPVHVRSRYDMIHISHGQRRRHDCNDKNYLYVSNAWMHSKRADLLYLKNKVWFGA